MIRNRNLIFGAIAVAVVSLCAAASFTSGAAAPQASGYHLAKKITLGGEGGWDYLAFDSPGSRVFISRGTHTMVVDADGKKLGDIPNTQGVHGIALAPEFNHGFTSNGRANTVTMFELDSLKTIREISRERAKP